MSGRVTVPVLWDKVQGCIVSNESSEIIRMFNSAFNHITGNDLDFWPVEMRDEIEDINLDITKTSIMVCTEQGLLAPLKPMRNLWPNSSMPLIVWRLGSLTIAI